MKSLTEFDVAGLSCDTNDGRSLLLHLMVTSCGPNMPEVENLLNVKRGIQTEMQCHFSKAEHELFSKHSVAAENCLAKKPSLVYDKLKKPTGERKK